jgi:hypothetical protein
MLAYIQKKIPFKVSLIQNKNKSWHKPVCVRSRMLMDGRLKPQEFHWMIFSIHLKYIK